MTAVWTFTITDGVGQLRGDDPDAKVNTFSSAAMDDFVAALVAAESAARQRRITALVLRSGKPGNFIAGADIAELQAIADEDEALAKARLGQRVFNRLAALPVPTVALIAGAALGGGLECALACDWRLGVDLPATRLGLPEVKLGIIPGWGGTQRLPRLVGLQQALPLILTGKLLDGRKALKIGLLDGLLPPHEVEQRLAAFLAGIRDPRRVASLQGRRLRPRLRRALLEGTAAGRSFMLDTARRQTRAAAGELYPAPFAAIELLRRSAAGALGAGLEDEARTFAHLATSPVSRNLVAVFFANEAMKKIGGRRDTRPIGAAGVLGAGVMGGGIAWLFASRDCRVRVRDLNWDALGKAWQTASDNFSEQVKRRKLSRDEARSKLATIGLGLDLPGFGSCDLVVEAVVEKLAVKQAVLAEVEQAIAPDCLLASNTSSLRIADMATALQRPERFLGMHFFNPVHRMPLVEVVPGAATDAAAVDRLVACCRQLGKTPIVVGDCPGFLVNRLLLPFMNEAAWLLHDGAGVVEVDAVLRTYGMPMGAFRLADEVGLDVGYKVAAILAEGYGERMAVAPILRALATDRQLLGRKGGAGFYRYRGGRRGDVHPAVAELLPAGGKAVPDANTIRDRCLLIMVNEAARCLAEAIVPDPAQLDMALLYGTGFPPAQGGLLRWADHYGPARIVDRLAHFAETVAPRFAPSPALLDIARTKGGFHGHRAHRHAA